MPYINPLHALATLPIFDKLARPKSPTPPEPEPVSSPDSVPTVNQILASQGCSRCGDMAVCATHANSLNLFPEEDEHLGSIPEVHPVSIVGNFERENYRSNRPQLHLHKEDKQAHCKAFAELNKMDVEEGPFCCGNLKIIGRESTMRSTDPDYPLVEDFINAVKDPERLDLNLLGLETYQLRNIDTVYKVNLYGRHVPFDAHSTWLYCHDPDEVDIMEEVFYGFMYFEDLQPFSSTKPYVTVGCAGDHKRQRYYRIGVYGSKWEKVGNHFFGGTFGDENLDKSMRMPARDQVKFGPATLESYFKDLVDEQEQIENQLFGEMMS